MLISVHFLLRFLFCIAKRFLMWWFLPDSFLQFLRNAFFTVIFQRFANKVLRLLRLKGMTTVTVSSEEAVTLLNEPNKNIFNKKDDLPTENFPKVVFVLGGPGCGKGTQCAKIVDKFGFTHLSAGDLLRAEINSGSENGTMIQNMVKEGKIVPAEVTVKLLQAAMRESGNDKLLIDGFPRDEENRAAFESVTGIIPEFILFFDCPEEEMEKRILSRNQGRVDDNSETIKKRFKVFVESSLPVINYYESLGRVRKIDAAKSMDEVFQSIQPLFLPSPKMVELEGDPRMAEVEAVDEARVATVRQ